MILAVLTLSSLGVTAFAEAGQSRAVIGANLNEEQIAAVYQLFNV